MSWWHLLMTHDKSTAFSKMGRVIMASTGVLALAAYGLSGDDSPDAHYKT